MAEEEEFLLATNGNKPDDKDDGGISNKSNHAEMNDEALSTVAHYIMVHCAEKEMLKKAEKEIQAKSWTIHARRWA